MPACMAMLTSLCRPADMAAAGASQFTFHLEAPGVDGSTEAATELARAVRAAGMQPGAAAGGLRRPSRLFVLGH